jgi:hypothetical protein
MYNAKKQSDLPFSLLKSELVIAVYMMLCTTLLIAGSGHQSVGGTMQTERAGLNSCCQLRQTL